MGRRNQNTVHHLHQTQKELKRDEIKPQKFIKKNKKHPTLQEKCHRYKSKNSRYTMGYISRTFVCSHYSTYT